MCKKGCKDYSGVEYIYSSNIIYEGYIPPTSELSEFNCKPNLEQVIEDIYKYTGIGDNEYYAGNGLILSNREFRTDFGTSSGKVMPGDWRPVWEDVVNRPEIPERVRLIGGDGIEVTGTYPEYIINKTSDSVGGIAGVSIDYSIINEDSEGIVDIPKASNNQFGVVKAGAGIQITEGVISVNIPEYEAGMGLTLNGNTFSLPITVTGSGSYVQSVTQGTDGINVSLGTPPNTTYEAGEGIQITGGHIVNTSPNATHQGDVSGSTTLTINSGVVSNDKLSNMPAETIKMNVSGVSGAPQDVGYTELKEVLNLGSKTEIIETFPNTIPISNHHQIAVFAKLDSASNTEHILNIEDGNFDGQQLFIEFNAYLSSETQASVTIVGNFIDFLANQEDIVVNSIRDSNFRRIFAFWSEAKGVWMLKIVKVLV